MYAVANAAEIIEITSTQYFVASVLALSCCVSSKADTHTPAYVCACIPRALISLHTLNFRRFVAVIFTRVLLHKQLSSCLAKVWQISWLKFEINFRKTLGNVL